MDNQYRYGLCYDLGQIIGFNLSPDLFICLTDDDIEKALETYVKRKLQLEPFINKPCVSEQACREDKAKALEKIRDEIIDTGAYEQETKGQTEFLRGINYCLSIIDKYKVERG